MLYPLSYEGKTSVPAGQTLTTPNPTVVIVAIFVAVFRFVPSLIAAHRSPPKRSNRRTVTGMGFVTESQIKQQAKNLQGQTNERLDAILAVLERQNELLVQLVADATKPPV